MTLIKPGGISSQTVQDGGLIYGADAGSTDAYAISLTPALIAYVPGQVINFKANTANTGACTLNVNGKGAKAIKKNVSEDLETGDILSGQFISVMYDGTNFQLINKTFQKMSAKGVYRSATFTSNALTYTDVTGMSVAVDANSQYYFVASFSIVDLDSANLDNVSSFLKIDIPSGSNFYGQILYKFDNVHYNDIKTFSSTGSDNTFEVVGDSNGANRQVYLSGILNVTTTAGNCKYQLSCGRNFGAGILLYSNAVMFLNKLN